MSKEIRTPEGFKLIDSAQYGLQVAERVLKGNVSGDISLDGNIRFVFPENVLQAQDWELKDEHTALLGLDPEDIPSVIFQTGRVPGSVKPGEKTILIDGDFFKPMHAINPERDREYRELFSDWCMMLFDTVTHVALDAYVPEVELTRNQEVFKALAEIYMEELIEINKNHGSEIPMDTVIAAHDKKLRSEGDHEERSVVARGLKVSLREGEERLITMNSIQDDNVRILIINELRSIFARTMKRQYFWFQPKKDMLSDHPFPEHEDGERVMELVRFAGCEGNMKELIRLYMSGELSHIFASLRISVSEEEDETAIQDGESAQGILLEPADAPEEGGDEKLIATPQWEVISDKEEAEHRPLPITISSAAKGNVPRPESQVKFGNSRELMGLSDRKKPPKKRRVFREDEEDEDY